MECNKEEALKAKEIAEKKFTELDITGAKRFALRAQNLCPELDGIPEFLATLDIYISAEKKTNAEVDWYKVLGVDPLADESTIRKQYRKLALTVHPDRNKSIGADGAFKIVSEAWTLLSDRGRRILYDQQQNQRAFYEQVLDGKSSVPTGLNGFHNLFNSNHSNGRDHRTATYCWPPSAPSHALKPTFWTMCNACKMQFEYLRSNLNHNLVCPNCRKPFFAFETPSPPLNGEVSFTSWNSHMQQRNSCPHTMMQNLYPPGRTPASTTNVRLAGISSSEKSFQAGSFPESSGVESVPVASTDAQAAGTFHPAFGNLKRGNVGLAGFSGVASSLKTFQAGSFSEAGGVESEPAASTAAQATGTLRPAFGKLKRGREEASVDGMREESHKNISHVFRKAGSVDGMREETQKIRSHVFKKAGGGLTTGSSTAGPSSAPKGDRLQKKRRANGQEMATSMGFGSQRGSFGSRRFNLAGNRRVNCIRELSQLEMRNVLMEKAKKEICKKLNEWRVAAVSEIQYKLEERENEKLKKEAVNPGVRADTSKCREILEATEKELARKCDPVKCDMKGPAVSMSVLDPDFHDFDEDRTEKSFGSNQIWAAYDEDDGMPRYYAMVHSVISLDPFKMRISWLNSKSNDEFSPLNWIGSGFPKTSGDFRVGKHEVYHSLNSFSHKVKWAKGIRGAIRIYPSKGEIWALYRNWSADWNELTPDEVIHKYDMVEVLEDYNENLGVSIAPLVKVPGFKTVFRKHPDPRKIWTIPRQEMFRFSHQVPSYFLTGHEARSPPKDCWELDPASTPMELLQVITEAQKEEIMETTEKVKGENPLECLKTPKVEEVIDNRQSSFQKSLIKDPGQKIMVETMKTDKETKKTNLLVYRRRLREEKRL
ncbi:hypothetical protein FNV43_RR19650 [Rhamnella rubrinervis]|uniref:J domain-containing protein n=1 Tax=Rhamnella rubrinervis TaxID=2594499 RepID=A0A8K0E4Y6_9ROSA|nr:hypothetical protein FNV43_RR19650 [Rhamnella rubrinervis]